MTRVLDFQKPTKRPERASATDGDARWRRSFAPIVQIVNTLTAPSTAQREG